MNRPILQGFMILSALFWTVMFFLPFFTNSKTDASISQTDKPAVEQTSRSGNQSTALGLMVVSWVGVAVLRSAKRSDQPAAEKA